MRRRRLSYRRGPDLNGFLSFHSGWPLPSRGRRQGPTGCRSAPRPGPCRHLSNVASVLRDGAACSPLCFLCRNAREPKNRLTYDKRQMRQSPALPNLHTSAWGRGRIDRWAALRHVKSLTIAWGERGTTGNDAGLGGTAHVEGGAGAQSHSGPDADRRSLLAGTALASTLLFSSLLAPTPAAAQQAVSIVSPTSVTTSNSDDCTFGGNCAQITTFNNGSFIDFYNSGTFDAGANGIFTTTRATTPPSPLTTWAI